MCPHEADLCCYWFEKARAQIAAGKAKRAGLLATQGIRGGANRKVLERIKETGDIFWARVDRTGSWTAPTSTSPWSASTTAARQRRILDGEPCATINANLTGVSRPDARPRAGGEPGLSFMGDTKGGSFDFPGTLRSEWLPRRIRTASRNSDVVRPWVNGIDLTGGHVTCGSLTLASHMPTRRAALYEAPFGYVERT